MALTKIKLTAKEAFNTCNTSAWWPIGESKTWQAFTEKIGVFTPAGRFQVSDKEWNNYVGNRNRWKDAINDYGDSCNGLYRLRVNERGVTVIKLNANDVAMWDLVGEFKKVYFRSECSSNRLVLDQNIPGLKPTLLTALESMNNVIMQNLIVLKGSVNRMEIPKATKEELLDFIGKIEDE